MKRLQTWTAMLALVTGLLLCTACESKGTYVSTVQPTAIFWDELLQQWMVMETNFQFNLYEKDGTLYAYLVDNQGKEHDDKRHIVNRNPGYQLPGRITADFEYHVQDWYF